jgi:hypothetical protein
MFLISASENNRHPPTILNDVIADYSLFDPAMIISLTYARFMPRFFDEVALFIIDEY